VVVLLPINAGSGIRNCSTSCRSFSREDETVKIPLSEAKQDRDLLRKSCAKVPTDEVP